jgi:hypothetical protein
MPDTRSSVKEGLVLSALVVPLIVSVLFDAPAAAPTVTKIVVAGSNPVAHPNPFIYLAAFRAGRFALSLRNQFSSSAD